MAMYCSVLTSVADSLGMETKMSAVTPTMAKDKAVSKRPPYQF